MALLITGKLSFLRVKKISFNIALLMALTLIARMAGLLREITLSYIYGASAVSDAYVMGTTFSTIVFAGFAAAFLNAYMPLASYCKTDRQFSVFTSVMTNISFLAALALGVVLVLFIRPLLSVFAVGFRGETLENTICISIPTILASCFLCLSSVMSGYLQSKNRFTSTGVQSILSNSIVVLMFFLTINNSFAMGLGYAASLIVPALVLFFHAAQSGFRYIPCLRDDFISLSAILRFSLPIFIGQIAMQLSDFINRAFASTLPEGTVSSLKYGALLCVFIISIVSVSIGTVIYPRICLMFDLKEEKEMAQLITTSLCIALIIIVPLVVGSVMLSRPIIRLLFERGAFVAADTELTRRLFSISAISMLGNSFAEILNRAFFARKNSTTPIIIYVLVTVLSILLNVGLIKFWGAYALAFTASLGSLLVAVLLLWAYKRKAHEFRPRRLIKTFCLSAIGGAVMAGFVRLTNALMPAFAYASGFWDKTAALIIPFGIGLAGYIAAMYFLKVPELATFRKRSPRKSR